MVWSSVHAERPSCSTSGGHSVGCAEEVFAFVAGGVVVEVVEVELVCCLVI